jgi:hypothetical protein
MGTSQQHDVQLIKVNILSYKIFSKNKIITHSKFGYIKKGVQNRSYKFLYISFLW